MTCSGGHTFTDGQQVVISSVGGMTDINSTFTVHNSTSTTFELFTVQTAATNIGTVDGTGFSVIHLVVQQNIRQ